MVRGFGLDRIQVYARVVHQRTSERTKPIDAKGNDRDGGWKADINYSNLFNARVPAPESSVMNSSTKPVLLYPRAILVAGVACFLFFGTFTLSSVLHPDTVSGCIGRPVTTGETLLVVATLGTFAILGAFLAASFFLERHELSRDDLASRNVLGRWKSIAWSDIKSVKYCPYPKAWFRLEARSGSVIRVSFALRGLPDFAQLVLERAPNAAMDPTTLAVFRAVALGHAPPMRLA